MGGTAGDVFDVRVLAFAGGSARTRQALQELFGLDPEAAQRMIDSVPMVVRRAAPANEAHDYVEALRNIGAEVALERPEKPATAERATVAKAAPPPPPPPTAKAPPPPPKALLPKPKAPPPPPRDAEPLPRPIIRAPTADLEFDLAPGRGAEPASSQDRVEPPGTPAAQHKRPGGGKRERSEFEWSGGNTGQLELDMDAARPAAAERSADKAASAGSERATLEIARPPAAASGDPPAARLSPAEVVRPAGPISRAAVVHKPGPVSLGPARRKRQLGLLRMLGAVLIAAVGVWLDSSVVYGNANVFSVLAHAFAIYHFGVGLRGMVS